MTKDQLNEKIIILKNYCNVLKKKNNINNDTIERNQKLIIKQKEIIKEQEKELERLKDIIKEAKEYIESYMPNYDFDKTNLIKLLEILQGSDKE